MDCLSGVWKNLLDHYKGFHQNRSLFGISDNQLQVQLRRTADEHQNSVPQSALGALPRNSAFASCGNKENNTIDNLRLISKEENTPHKLSFEIAEEIRRRYAEGETKAALGKEFGVSQKAIYHIIYRRTYRHPPEKMYYRGRV